MNSVNWQKLTPEENGCIRGVFEDIGKMDSFINASPGSATNDAEIEMEMNVNDRFEGSIHCANPDDRSLQLKDIYAMRVKTQNKETTTTDIDKIDAGKYKLTYSCDHIDNRGFGRYTDGLTVICDENGNFEGEPERFSNKLER
jgi:hypothetical protein